MKCRQLNRQNGSVVWFGSGGKNGNGTAIKMDNYLVDSSQAVADLLQQKLSNIRGELEMNRSYGLPLTNTTRKIDLDMAASQIIYGSQYVTNISKFESKVIGHTYTLNCKIETIYGEIVISTNNNMI